MRHIAVLLPIVVMRIISAKTEDKMETAGIRTEKCLILALVTAPFNHHRNMIDRK